LELFRFAQTGSKILTAANQGGNWRVLTLQPSCIYIEAFVSSDTKGELTHFSGIDDYHPNEKLEKL
jgi:hypothetical protein